MSFQERILELKREYYEDNLSEPRFVIMSHSIYMDFKIELFGDAALAIENQLYEFEGLKICVINDPVENILHVTK